MSKKNIYASAIATGIAEIATLPICTVKTNYQTQSNSITGVVSNIYSTRGIKGFYNSSLWAVSSQIVSTTTKYTFYRKLETHVPNKFLAGTLSGAMSSLLTHPLDVLKMHYQTNTPFTPKFSIFYRGYTKTLSKAAIGSTFFYPIYDTFNKYTSPMIASMLSAIISTTLLHPIDYMKTRRVLDKKIDFKSLYKGLSLNLFRVVPHFTITMTLISYIENIK